MDPVCQLLMRRGTALRRCLSKGPHLERVYRHALQLYVKEATQTGVITEWYHKEDVEQLGEGGRAADLSPQDEHSTEHRQQHWQMRPKDFVDPAPHPTSRKPALWKKGCRCKRACGAIDTNGSKNGDKAR